MLEYVGPVKIVLILTIIFFLLNVLCSLCKICLLHICKFDNKCAHCGLFIVHFMPKSSCFCFATFMSLHIFKIWSFKIMTYCNVKCQFSCFCFATFFVYIFLRLKVWKQGILQYCHLSKFDDSDISCDLMNASASFQVWDTLSESIVGACLFHFIFWSWSGKTHWINVSCNPFFVSRFLENLQMSQHSGSWIQYHVGPKGSKSHIQVLQDSDETLKTD